MKPYNAQNLNDCPPPTRNQSGLYRHSRRNGSKMPFWMYAHGTLDCLMFFRARYKDFKRFGYFTTCTGKVYKRTDGRMVAVNY